MSSTIFKKGWPYFALILAHSIWGVNFVIAKLALQEIPPMTLAFFRFSLASLLLLPFIIISNEPPWTNLCKIFHFLPKFKTSQKTKLDDMEGKTENILQKEDLPKIVIVSVLMAGLNVALFFTGLTKTDVISASVLTMIIPVISVILGWMVLREKIYVVNIFGILAGLIGAVAVLGLPLIPIGAGFGTNAMVGNVLIILSSISWVIGAILSKQVLKKYSTLTITFMVFLIGAFIFLVPAINEFFQDPGWPNHLTFLGIFGIIYMTLASSISAYFLFQWGLDQLGVTKADLFQYLEPVIAISLGILILGEKLRFSFVIGTVLIILGVYWSTLGKENHKHHKAHRT